MITRRASQLSYLRLRSACLLLLISIMRAPHLIAQNTNNPTQPELADGIQLLRNGQANEAKAKFDAAVHASPRSADALTWRGICENQLQEYARAAEDFQSAIRLDKAMLAAHYNLALSLIRLRKNDAAIDQLRIVVATQPHAVQPLYNLAILLEANGSFAEAAERLRVAHTAAPEDKGVTLHLLIDTLHLKQTADVSTLVTSLRESATPPEIQIEAATAFLEAGKFPDAIMLLQAAREREPASSGTDLLLARSLIGNKQDAEAITVLETATLASNESEERSYLLALAYLGTGAVPHAIASLETAARLDPKDARPLYQLGLITEATPHGQAEALRLLQSAHTLDPGNTRYSLALARVLLAGDQAQESETLLLGMHAVNEDEAQRLALLGVALAATHRIAEAIPELKNAVDRDPNLALAHNVLGFCYLQQGQYASAAEAYGKASDIEPSRALYAQDAALAFERAGQREQAMRFAKRAASLDDTNAGEHALLGKLYAASGSNAQAVQELLRALTLNPDLDSACYLLARTYQQMGDRQQATAWSEKLRALKQKHEADFALQKKAEATAIRSSTLLQGGSLGGDQADVP